MIFHWLFLFSKSSRGVPREVQTTRQGSQRCGGGPEALGWGKISRVPRCAGGRLLRHTFAGPTWLLSTPIPAAQSEAVQLTWQDPLSARKGDLLRFFQGNGNYLEPSLKSWECAARLPGAPHGAGHPLCTPPAGLCVPSLHTRRPQDLQQP